MKNLEGATREQNAERQLAPENTRVDTYRTKKELWRLYNGGDDGRRPEREYMIDNSGSWGQGGSDSCKKSVLKKFYSPCIYALCSDIIKKIVDLTE